MKRGLILLIAAGSAFGQTGGADRIMNAYADRAMADQVARLKTDERIKMYQALTSAQPENLHYANLLAGTFIQKMRESTDFGYLDRASQIVNDVISRDSGNYEALRLRSEVELERHNFKKVAEYSRDLIKMAPDDPWNWGTLGDALIEIGDYENAADAYQKMVAMRPDLSSYNRAAWYHFLAGDMPGAIAIMEQAIKAGSSSPENTAWCLVELGHLFMKSGRIDEASQAYSAAVRVFPGYHPGYAGLGRSQAARGDLKAAIANFERAQASTPLPDYAADLFDLYSATGDTKNAQNELELVDLCDKIGRNNGETANRNLAMIYANHDVHVDRALELAKAELNVRQDIYTYDTLAWALYKNGKVAEAETAIKVALKLGTPEPMFYYHAGMIAVDPAKKKEYLKKALELNPHFDFRQAPVAEKTLKGVAE